MSRRFTFTFLRIMMNYISKIYTYTCTSSVVKMWLWGGRREFQLFSKKKLQSTIVNCSWIIPRVIHYRHEGLLSQGERFWRERRGNSYPVIIPLLPPLNAPLKGTCREGDAGTRLMTALLQNWQLTGRTK